MSYDSNKTDLEAPEPLYTKDGYKITSVESTGRKSSSWAVERFFANSLHMMGVNSFLGFQTHRDMGTGEVFNPEGKSLGRTKIFGEGFQKKPGKTL